MKKADLVEKVAEQKNLSKQQVESTVDAFLDGIVEALSKGERVDIRGFGSFVVRESAARSGRNPRTGETIEIAARKSPAFRVGKELKDRVNPA
jgi:DNA-binding protein HU-beta